MNSRDQSKLKFAELLREDAKKARKCLKGKECGGRCIPANWNCRLKGEGETPPTRGNLATLSPELKNKIATRRRNESISNFTKLALAAGGAAAAGAVLNKRGVSPKEVTQGAATAAGLVSALNPAISGPVTLAAVAAGAGAGLANASSKGERFKARVTGVAAAAARTRKLIARRRTELAADRKAFNELQEKIQKTTDDKQRRRFIAESKARLKQIGNNEERIKALSESVPGRERLVTRARTQGKITLGKVIKAATKGANEGTKTARSIRSQSLKNRSALGLTAFGQPGAKVKFSDWRANPRNTQDSVDVRSDLKGQKCGGSYISPSKKCSKGASGNAGSSARAIEKAVAATALIAGGATALSMAGRSSKTPFVRGRRMTRSEVVALKRMRRTKPRGMYETKKLRSFTSAIIPYYTEAVDAEGKKLSKSSRIDAGDKRRGKPCGASYISKAKKCHTQKGSGWNKMTAIAGIAAVAAGGYALSQRNPDRDRKPRLSPAERKAARLARQDRMSEEKALKITNEAIAGGKVWDVQEKINKRRKAEIDAQCGGGLGKIQAPAKFDAMVREPRCQVGEGAYGTYFVHTSGKYGVKVFRNGDEDDVEKEFDLLDRARAAGVNVPKPLAHNRVLDQDGYTMSQTLVLEHMSGYKEAAKLYSRGGYDLSNAPLVIKVKALRELKKLNVDGLAHGDIHGGNILVNPRSKKVALIDFGYATAIDDPDHPHHGRSGVETLIDDLKRVRSFVGVETDLMQEKTRPILQNIKNNAENYNRDWEKYELSIKRYYDFVEAEVLQGMRKPRSRFVSGADQLRIPGLTRRIVTGNRPITQRLVMAQLFEADPTLAERQAKRLGIKKERLRQALKPEFDLLNLGK